MKMMDQLSARFGKAAKQPEPAAAKKRKRPSPLSVRLNEDERAKLERAAAGQSLNSYVKERLFAGKRTRKSKVNDYEALAKALSLLGRSDIQTRLDTEHMKAVQLSFTKRKMQDLSRELYREHGWTMPRGFERTEFRDRQTQQLDAVCDEMHIEYVSAVADARPVFEAVLSDLRDGDTFVVLDLDRAFRSSVDAILTAEALRERGIKFRILSLQVDTNTPEGELFYTLLACFAQFERKLLSRRTKEGLSVFC